MASTTKAGKIWQLLHKNDNFASSMLLAVIKDDPDAVQEALDIVDLGADDLHLTDGELESFARGVIPSGSLELTSWEGYYVTDPLPNGDKYALFITAIDNGIFWGPESQLMNDFPSHEVSYQLHDDGTLHFSTPSGDIALTFSREHDTEAFTVSVGSFKVRA